MGTKYGNGVSISGYNATPPADDGSQVSSNQITWSKHKLKLGDPLKTAIESINSALVTALDTSVRTVTSNDTTTTSDHLKTIQCTTASAGITVSLGDAATMAAGYIVTVHNRASSAGNVTVDLASNSDSLNNVTNGTRLLPPGSALTFIVASPANGYLIAGSDGAFASPFWVEVSGALRRITAPAYDITLGNMPAGVIMDYAGSSVPTGWLECDGSAVSRTTYADLFTAIGTVWGAGDTSSTFNLPDLRGRTRIGRGTGALSETFASGAVDTSAVTIAVSANDTKWITGMMVQLTTTGSLPGGVSTSQITGSSGTPAPRSSWRPLSRMPRTGRLSTLPLRAQGTTPLPTI